MKPLSSGLPAQISGSASADFSSPEKTLATYISAVEANDTKLFLESYSKASAEKFFSKVDPKDPLPDDVHKAVADLKTKNYQMVSHTDTEAKITQQQFPRFYL